VKLSNINWNLYKYFIAVYETRNINRCAETLGVSPSAVSQNIKELSNQLGVSLFSTGRHGAEPTSDAGRIYLSIKKASEHISKIETEFEIFNSESVRTVKMAMHGSFAKAHVNAYLMQFRAQYPNVQLAFFQSEDINLLTQGKIDLMIDLDFVFDGTDIKKIFIGPKYDLHFVASKSYAEKHRLQKVITKGELVQHPIIERIESWTKIKKTLDPDYTPKEINAQTAEQVISMVKDSVGIGCFSGWLLRELNDPDLIELKVKDMVLPSTRFVCGYNKSLSRPAKAFVDGLIRFCS